MKTKLTVVTLLIIIFIVGVSLWLIFSKLTKSESWTNYCLKQKEPSLVCTQILVDKGIFNSSACLNIHEGKERDVCYYYAARNKNDISICQKINDANWLSFCKTVLQKNPDLCNGLISEDVFGDYWVKRCYEDLAKINNNISLCNHFKGTYEYVDCYQGVASYYDNIKICKKLENKEQINQCKLQYFNFEKGY